MLRLDPLAEDDTERILNARSGIDDGRSFMDTAKEKGVAGFLDNPQCLGMLADVVTRCGGWPASRLELFDQACRLALREQNEEHRAAARASAAVTTPEDDLLDAAGRLCAVLLISGAAGCATVPEREDADYLDLSRCARECREQCGQAVSTKLFTAVAGERFQAVHRHVAEFVAGRYLARLIEGERRYGRQVRDGVPARRIIALIAGHDGGVVTELRGLSAWIAAQGQSARNDERRPARALAGMWLSRVTGAVRIAFARLPGGPRAKGSPFDGFPVSGGIHPRLASPPGQETSGTFHPPLGALLRPGGLVAGRGGDACHVGVSARGGHDW